MLLGFKMRVAIIGTAGRDKYKPMTLNTWRWMLDQARELIPSGSYLVSGGAANYYHSRFANIIGVNTIEQILECYTRNNCTGSMQPVMSGYSAMFNRNKLVVSELNPDTDLMLAFTFGTNGVADGGTKHTWDMFRGANKRHVQIPLI